MKIEILLFDGFDDLDAFGPFEVLAGARLDTTFVTAEPVEYVTSAGGARVIPHGVVGDPDIVLVPGGGWNDKGGPGCAHEAKRGVIPDAPARAPRGRPSASARSAPARCCSPRRASSRAAARPPTTPPTRTCATYDVDVVEDARFVDEGDIITSAGITAGIDMALHLVNQALGAKAAEASSTELEWNRRVPVD